MTRRIFTTQLETADGTPAQDGYFAKLLKNIPADIVAAWMLVSSLINSAADVDAPTILWIAFGVGVVLTAMWTLKQTSVPGKKPAITQTIIATGAFIIWVFALGGPFANLAFYRPLYGSLVMVLYTLLVAFINPPEG